jgi:hypothetical protein
MWHHFVNLLYQSVGAFLSALGTTLLGWLVQGIIWFGAIEAATYLLVWRLRGKAAMKDRFAENFKTGFYAWSIVMVVIYGTIFGWQVIKAVYDDHQNLAAQVQGLRNAPKPTCPTCPQPGDQRLKILTRYYAMKDNATVNEKSGRVMLIEGLTNKPITPVDVNLNCDQDITLLNQPWLGIGGMYTFEKWKMIGKRGLQIRIGSPAWTPEAPLGVPVFIEAKDIDCKFELNEMQSP